MKSEVEGNASIDTEAVDYLLDLNDSIEVFVSHSDENGLSHLSISEALHPPSSSRRNSSNLSISTETGLEVSNTYPPVSIDGLSPILGTASLPVESEVVVPDNIKEVPDISKECTRTMDGVEVGLPTISEELRTNDSVGEVPAVSNEYTTTEIPADSNATVTNILNSLTLFPQNVKPKKQINPRQLLSVISSQKWRDLFNAQEDEKKKKKKPKRKLDLVDEQDEQELDDAKPKGDVNEPKPKQKAVKKKVPKIQKENLHPVVPDFSNQLRQVFGITINWQE